jgi:transcriptional regulator with XRE-family HTH domain
MDRNVQIDGRKLAALRRGRFLTQRDIAEALAVAEGTVSRYEQDQRVGVLRRNFRALADVFKMPADELLAKVGAPAAPAATNGNAGPFEVTAVLDEAPAVFSLGIAASGWVELEGEGRSHVGLRGTWIIVRVSGDSMEPRWLDGQSVQFHRLNLEEDSPVVGADYFFVRNDGTGTFKRVEHIDEDGYTLRALNPKYTRPLTVSRQEVVMVAEARWIVTEPPDI